MNFLISQVAAILHVLMSRNGLWMDMTNIYSSLEANKPLLEEAGEPHCLSVIHRQRPPNLVVRRRRQIRKWRQFTRATNPMYSFK